MNEESKRLVSDSYTDMVGESCFLLPASGPVSCRQAEEDLLQGRPLEEADPGIVFQKEAPARAETPRLELSGVPEEWESESHSGVSDSLRPHGL